MTFWRLKMLNFTKNSDLSVSETLSLLRRAHSIANHDVTVLHELDGMQMASLFYEPSTRTRLSFASAMNALGGSTIGFESSSSASVAKGESLADTIRVASQYADLIVLRHPDISAPDIALANSSVPLINAGNGADLHPTQTLADLMTIYENKKTLSGLHLTFAGDLKYGRTVHSLVKELLRFGNNTFTFVSPDELRIPNELRTKLTNTNTLFYEEQSIQTGIHSADIIYLTRIQTERFPQSLIKKSPTELTQVENFKPTDLDANTLLMHPLPRGTELPREFDVLPQAKYFDQVRFGKYARMALIELLISKHTSNTK
ncbi:aspartate carbamoyltransferase [Lactiplantibacillus pentosus]|nr:aspartate carbamoyltransferase [Lactiplantibacillus pentosus]PRO80036.1 aspartate carbamoyltransferase [Lactiplantibacillus pentosus]PRO82801.1 aspartate carbamoyltransferase [Lactiplantibacillus pentosus]PRO92704.1 aspartate carbamoyltransferase [Lactiplantibacillus pentosus]